ncbi:MAG: RHS repeat domain-containing protein, partial [Planctomycetaceae bacterium]
MTHCFHAPIGAERTTAYSPHSLTRRSQPSKRATFTLSPTGERTSVTRAANVTGTQVVAKTTATYDLAGRLTEWKHVRNSAGTEINRYTWSYAPLGRPVTQTSVDGTSTFQYDQSSQVTAVTHTGQVSENYQYDSNGNRTNTGTSTGTNNRLLSDDRYDYQYDAEGNRTRRTDRATGQYQILAWDHRNRLTSVTTFSAAGTRQAGVEYTYDLFDRRIARQVDADGAAGFETTQRFVYDGEDLILAFSGSTNALTNRYLYGPATDEILADEQLGTTSTGTAGIVTWSLDDHLGTIRDLVQYTAATGTTTVVNHVRYDTFGQIVSQTNSQFQPWFAYTGREWDPAVGLYFYRARWYDPRAGRFL